MIPEGCKVLEALPSQMAYEVYYQEGTYVTRDVEGRDRPLCYYAIIPTKGSPMGSRGDDSLRFPAIVYCQGSGWHQQWIWHHLAHHVRMAERGFVVVSVEVRPYGETVFPGEVDDFATAVRFLREHAAELRIDADRIAFWGDSSGAHTALMAAYDKGGAWLDRLREYLFHNARTVSCFLEDELPQVNMPPLEGTYLMWLDCRAALKPGEPLDGFSERFGKYLQEKVQLTLSPGSMYGAAGEGFMRLNIACPRTRLLDAMQRFIAGFVNFKNA